MKIGERTQHSLDLAREHGITPPDCSCGQSNGWNTPTVDGTTVATDDGAVVWQCQGCGRYSSLTAAQIAARIH